MPPAEQAPQPGEVRSEVTRPAAVPVPSGETAPLSDNVEELLAQGAIDLAQARRATPPRAEEEEAEPGEEAAGGDEDEESEEEEGEQEEGEPEVKPPTATRGGQFGELAAAGRYAEALLLDPQRHTEIPLRERGKAIGDAVRLAAQSVARDAAVLFMEQRRKERRLETIVRERDALAEEDPDAFVDWQRKSPREAREYFEARDFFASLDTANPLPLPGGAVASPAPERQPASASAQEIQQRINTRLVPRLMRLPEASVEQIAERARSEDFRQDQAGYDRLEAAIDDAYAALATNGASAPKSPAHSDKRRQAAARRREVARPEVGAGITATKPNPLADENDVMELFRGAAEDAAKRRQRGEPVRTR